VGTIGTKRSGGAPGTSETFENDFRIRSRKMLLSPERGSEGSIDQITGGNSSPNSPGRK